VERLADEMSRRGSGSGSSAKRGPVRRLQTAGLLPWNLSTLRRNLSVLNPTSSKLLPQAPLSKLHLYDSLPLLAMSPLHKRQGWFVLRRTAVKGACQRLCHLLSQMTTAGLRYSISFVCCPYSKEGATRLACHKSNHSSWILEGVGRMKLIC
jgi:hypothetical protein